MNTDNSATYAAPLRLPVCICLDTGTATSDEPEKLFRHLMNELQSCFDNTLCEPFEPELSLICCGGGGACSPTPFRTPESLRKLPPLCGGGASRLGEGVTCALDTLAERLELYRREGLPSLTPRLIIISKGGNHGSPDLLHSAAARVRRLRRNGRLITHILCPGQPVQQANLHLFSPRRNGRSRLRALLCRLRSALHIGLSHLRFFFTSHPTIH